MEREFEKCFMPDTGITCIDGRWYAFAISEDELNVLSIGADRRCGLYSAKFTDDGIKYVASPSPSRGAAYAKAYRNGNYRGEWT